MGIVLAAWLAFSGVLLAMRAAHGAIRPLHWRQLALVTLSLLATAWMSHAAVAWRGSRRQGERTTLICGALTSAGMLLWAISLTRGAGSHLIGTAIFLALIAEEAWAWRNVTVSGRRPTRAVATNRVAEVQMVQQFTRTITAAGEEIIQGRIALHVERGRRMAAAHVAFCPPFLERPQFDARLATNASGALKVTQLYAHGARIEVRLPQTTDTGVRLVACFTARWP